MWTILSAQFLAWAPNQLELSPYTRLAAKPQQHLLPDGSGESIRRIVPWCGAHAYCVGQEYPLDTRLTVDWSRTWRLPHRHVIIFILTLLCMGTADPSISLMAMGLFRRLLDRNYNLGACEFRGFPSFLLSCHLCSSGICFNLGSRVLGISWPLTLQVGGCPWKVLLACQHLFPSWLHRPALGSFSVLGSEMVWLDSLS